MIAWLTENMVVAVVVMFAVGLPVAQRLLLLAARPMRDALADDLRALSTLERLSGEARDGEARELLDFMVDHALDWRVMLAFAFGFPLTVGREVVSRRAAMSTPLDGHDAQTQRVIDRVVHRFVLSAATVNPLAALVLLAEMALVLAVGGVLRLVHLTTLKPLQQADASLRAILARHERYLLP